MFQKQPSSPGRHIHTCRASKKPTLIKQGVCHTAALPFTLKKIFRAKKNYGNSNISPCKSIIFQKKSSKRNQNPSRHYNFITNLKFHSTQAQNIIFQKSSYRNRPIYYLGAKIP
jgi:hypothetical protein